MTAIRITLPRIKIAVEVSLLWLVSFLVCPRPMMPCVVLTYQSLSYSMWQCWLLKATANCLAYVLLSAFGELPLLVGHVHMS